jgi:DNA-binding CsgD family transcriptional regulator
MELCGLQAESRTIEERLAAAEDGASSILLIEGRAGEGKSALLINSVMSALDSGFTAAVAADLQTLSVTGWPFSSLPSFVRATPVLDAEPGLPKLRCWLHRQSQQRLATDADRRKGPLLVALDDLHELGPRSARALNAVLTQDLPCPVVWLLARRGGQGDQRVQRVFSLGCRDVVRIQLKIMQPPQTAALIADVAHTRPSPEMLALATLAGGNRLLVVELVRGLIEEHGESIIRSHAGLDRVALPRRLRNAVLVLLRTVSMTCRRMLEVAALAGRPVSLPAVADLLGEPPGALIPPIREAIEAGVLTSKGGELCFTQDLTRRALLEEIPAAVRNVLGSAAAPDQLTISGPRSAGTRGAARRDDGANAAILPRASWADPDGAASRHLRFSSTQWSIALLVAEGLTNQQIASRLFLSRHTVNYHLREIFHLLDIHSRVELAALIQRCRP